MSLRRSCSSASCKVSGLKCRCTGTCDTKNQGKEILHRLCRAWVLEATSCIIHPTQSTKGNEKSERAAIAHEFSKCLPEPFLKVINPWARHSAKRIWIKSNHFSLLGHTTWSDLKLWSKALLRKCVLIPEPYTTPNYSSNQLPSLNDLLKTVER